MFSGGGGEEAAPSLKYRQSVGLWPLVGANAEVLLRIRDETPAFLHATRHFAEHLDASGLGDMPHLYRDAQPVCGDRRVAVFRRGIARQVYESEKSHVFKAQVYLC